ncbi:hypothetical protein HBI95_129460 [Parastagonospora nodorum]|nr:hypothetical protein HBI95_129460 [Parastagonospora nodorum]
MVVHGHTTVANGSQCHTPTVLYRIGTRGMSLLKAARNEVNTNLPHFHIRRIDDHFLRQCDESLRLLSQYRPLSRREFLPCECSPKARPISASSSRPHAAIHGPACSTMQRRDRPSSRPISRCAGEKGNKSDLSRNLSFEKMRCCLDELSACCGCKMRACVLSQSLSRTIGSLAFRGGSWRPRPRSHGYQRDAGVGAS